MTVLLIEPGKRPNRTEIDGSLEGMQNLVGGLIQAVYPFHDDEVALIVNDEGKLLGLPLNRALRNEDGDIYDVISGPFFLCAAPLDSDHFVSLTEEQVHRYQEQFLRPEVFLRINGRLLCVPVDD